MRTLVAGPMGLGMLFLFLAVVTADEKGGKKVPPVLNFEMKTLQGKDIHLADYQGKVILIVNVASKCGYTPQYKGLQALHDKYAKDGLVILGVPCNDFGRQEPGTSKEIAEFCDKNYGVKFELLEKVTVKGKNKAPLYRYLTSTESNPHFGGDIKWNFTKFLISRAGQVLNRFEPDVEPESTDMVKTIEEELAKK